MLVMSDLQGEDEIAAAMPDRLSRNTEALDAAEAVLEALLPAGSVVNYLVERIPAVQRVRAQRMMHELLEIIAVEASELIRRVQRDDRLAQLLFDAGRAAAQTLLDAKITALARVVAPTWLDNAKIDEARYIVQTIGQLEVLHIRVLRALEERAADHQYFNADLNVSSLLGCGAGLGNAIAADLVRLGVAEQGTKAAPPMGSTPVPGSVSPSAFGAQVLQYLAEHPTD
jgi:hypothetical protein